MSEPEAGPDSQETVISFLAEEEDKRLDKVVRDRVSGLSRTKGQRLIENQRVTVDGRPEKPAYRVAVGDRITIRLPPPSPELSLRPEPIPLDVIYEDRHVLVVSKPAGIVVHPAPGHPSGTLVNALLNHYPPIAEVGPRDRPGIVHRLDKETSGLLVVAKNQDALEALQEQFRRREVGKAYLALVQGRVQPPEGIIEVPIGRHAQHRQKMAARSHGKYARTRFHAIESYRAHTLLEVHPYTGRTHQIRVHLSWLGHPVVGDPVYGRREQPLLKERHFLHAFQLRFDHPASGEPLAFDDDLPPGLKSVLDQLRASRPR